MGNQFAGLIKKLEKVKCKDIKGAGRLEYSVKDKDLKFQYPDASEYFQK